MARKIPVKLILELRATHHSILDEWLLQDVSKKELEFLFELSERRFDATSTIFCTFYRQD